ncbi:MAG: hypothetical protein ACTSVI_04750 [Promethearchaeota archaeon]
MLFNKKKLITLGFLLVVLFSVMVGTSIATKYSEMSNKLSISNTPDDPFQIGAIRLQNTAKNILVRSDQTGRFYTFDYKFSEQSNQQVTNVDNYPLVLNSIQDGTDPSNPFSLVNWVGVANNTNETGKYDFSLANIEETVNPGEEKVITANNTLSTLIIKSNLEAEKNYIMIFNNIAGNFLGATMGINIMDPKGLECSFSGPYNLGANMMYLIISARQSGQHAIYFSYNVGGTYTVVKVELKEIPNKPLTAGQYMVFGDDVRGSISQAMEKKFTYTSFSLGVSTGDVIKYVLSITASYNNPRIFVAYPTPVNNMIIPYGKINSLINNGQIMQSSGKITIISIEESWIYNLIEYKVMIDKYQVKSQGVSEVKSYSVQPFSMQPVKIHIGKETILRINVTESPNVSAVKIDGLFKKCKQDVPFLMMFDAVGLDVSASTFDDYDKFFLVPPGDYILLINNIVNTDIGKISVETRVYDDNVDNNFLTTWEDTYNLTSNSWIGFDDDKDFQHVTFQDAGKNTGAKVARAFKFSTDKIDFIKLRFQLRLENNSAFNTIDSWSGKLKFVLIGQNGHFTSEKFSQLIKEDTDTWTFNNGTISTARTYESTSFLTLLSPGNYYLFVTLDNWENQSGTNDFFNGSVVLSMRVMDFNNHFFWTEYEISSRPTYHAYAYASNSFRTKKFLNFSAVYNNESYYDLTLQNLNGRRYDFGVMYRVKRAKPYAWTQLLAYYKNCVDLGDNTNTPAINEATTSGISIIYDGFWSSTGMVYYNHKISFQNGGYKGQSNVTNTTGTYSMEFGVYSNEFYLWINPEEYTVGDADLNETLSIELTQYDTPMIDLKSSASFYISSETLMTVTIIASASIAVVIVLVILYKKGKLKVRKF